MSVCVSPCVSFSLSLSAPFYLLIDLSFFFLSPSFFLFVCLFVVCRSFSSSTVGLGGVLLLVEKDASRSQSTSTPEASSTERSASDSHHSHHPRRQGGTRYANFFVGPHSVFFLSSIPSLSLSLSHTFPHPFPLFIDRSVLGGSFGW